MATLYQISSWLPLQGRKFDKSAAEFIADTVSRDPGNVSILALGPLTNIAMAFQVGPEVARNVVSLPTPFF